LAIVVCKRDCYGEIVGALSAFVLPLVVGVGLYFLLLVIFPSMNQLAALVIGIVAAWTIRVLLKRIQM
jgi:putative flippase GtrA